MAASTDRVLVDVADGVADVRMNRADKRNALDGAMFLALAEAGAGLRARPDVRVVVLHGDGPSFCAGLDFSSFEAMAGGKGAGGGEGNPGALQADGMTHLGQQVAWTWQQVPVPVIAAVHGHALGGGLQIALGADLRIVHPATQMSVREVHWGLVPDMTGTHFLTRLVPHDVAFELAVTARVFDGAEAARLGLATRLSETPLDDARALARQIAAQSPSAVRGVKELFSTMATERASEHFEAERSVISGLIGRPHQVEAVMANLERRPPVYADVDPT